MNATLLRIGVGTSFLQLPSEQECTLTLTRHSVTSTGSLARTQAEVATDAPAGWSISGTMKLSGTTLTTLQTLLTGMRNGNGTTLWLRVPSSASQYLCLYGPAFVTRLHLSAAARGVAWLDFAATGNGPLYYMHSSR